MQPATHEKVSASKGGFLNLSTTDVLGQKIQMILRSRGCLVHGRVIQRCLWPCTLDAKSIISTLHPAVTATTVCRPCLISAQRHGPCLRTVALNRRQQRSDSLMSPLRVFPSGLGHALLRADQSREREPGVGSGRCNLERQPPSLLTLLSRDTHAQVKARRHCLSPDSLWQGKAPRAVSLTLAVFLAPMCSPRAFHRAAPCPPAHLARPGESSWRDWPSLLPSSCWPSPQVVWGPS